jgi:hypothetical protein
MKSFSSSSLKIGKLGEKAIVAMKDFLEDATIKETTK